VFYRWHFNPSLADLRAALLEISLGQTTLSAGRVVFFSGLSASPFTLSRVAFFPLFSFK